MSKADTNEKLSKVKLALAEKCDRLIRVTTSVPKRKKLIDQATRFRRQATDLVRQ